MIEGERLAEIDLATDGMEMEIIEGILVPREIYSICIDECNRLVYGSISCGLSWDGVQLEVGGGGLGYHSIVNFQAQTAIL